jgi:TolB-like protein
MRTKISFIMITLLAMLSTVVVNAQDKMKIAVMDFNSGVGVDVSMVNGLSDMLINSLFETRRFTIVERTQLNKAIQEQGFQKSNLSAGQIAKVGKILGVKFVLVGTVNFIATKRTTEQVTTGMISGEFNLDVRIVDVESGEIVSTAGVTKSGAQTYRSLMPELAKDITSKLSNSNGSVVVLLGYLYVFPEDLGYMTYQEAQSACANVNAVNAYGYDDWRIPSDDEVKVVQQNAGKVNLEGRGYGSVNKCTVKWNSWSQCPNCPEDASTCWNDDKTKYVRLVRKNR